MEKIITLFPNRETGEITVELDGEKAILATSLVIPSWNESNTAWFWKLNREEEGKPASATAPKLKRFLVSTELYRQGVLEYAGRNIAIGRFGTSIILGGGKPIVRAVDKSVTDFMKAHEISALERRLPSVARIRHMNATSILRVFDLEGNEQHADSTGGSFFLDGSKPWIVEHRRVEGSTSTEWKSLFVPPGFKFRDEEEPPKPKRQNKKPAAPAQQPKPPVVNDSVEPPQQNTSVFGGEVPVEDQQRLFANEQMTAEDRAACEPSIEQQQKQFAREMMAEEAAAPTPDAPAEEIQLKIEGQDNGSCPAESPLAEECETSQTPPVANEAGDAQTAVTGQPVLG